MPYIGNDIQYGELNSQTFTGDGSTTAFTLTYTVSNVNSLLVTVADVIQEPTTAYTVSGTTLTFTSAPANSDTIHVRYLGRTLDVGTTAIVQDSDQDTKIQVEESADEDTIRFDAGGTEIATATATSFNINNLNNTAASGIIESNANFVDTCLVGPSVDGKAWAGKFENGSVWSSLMLATVETSGANAEVNIWDLTAGVLASASPLATVTLTGATPTSIAASMGYVIVGTSDQGMHIVDPHGGSWAERTIGWPRTLTTSTTPALADNNVVKVFANAYVSTSEKDPRTAGPVPTFAVYYGAGAVSSIITDTGSVYDDTGTPQADAVALLTDGGTLLFNDGNAGRVQALQSQDIHGITADNWGGSIFIRSNNYPQGFGADNGADNAGDRFVFADTDGLTLAIAAHADIFAANRNWMTALLTTTYNTGFLVGDIRLAALANSKTADRSYNANTLTENGTVTEAAVETGSELLGYSGFTAATNYLSMDPGTSMDFGTGNFSCMIWFKCSSDDGGVFFQYRETGAASNTGSWQIQFTGSGNVMFRVRDTGGATSAQTGPWDDGEWHLAVGVRDGVDAILYIDGVHQQTATAGSTKNVTQAAAQFFIGQNADGAEDADATELALCRVTGVALSATQVREIYEAEKGMYVANAKCLLQGAGNAVLDARIDPLTGKYIVTQSDTQDIFDGLTIETERTIASGGTTFEHGLLWGDGVAEINDANLYASMPATDQRQVNEMVRSMSAELPAGVDLSKAKAWCVYDHVNEVIDASYNVESATNVGAGSFYLTWAVPFKDKVVVLVSADRGDAMIDFGASGTEDMSKKAYFLVKNTGTNTAGDAITFVAAFGELENE